jgi:hypothetical protein
MTRRNHRTLLRVEELERRDVPSSGLLGMPTALLPGHEPGEGSLIRLRRVVGDTAVAPGHAQGSEPSSFQWGVGRGISSSAAGTVMAADAQWIELSSFQWGVGRAVEANAMNGRAAQPMGGPVLAASPVETVSLNF